MATVPTNGIEIEYEVHGERGGRPLVLVGGLGQQLVGWHPDLTASLTMRGYRVVTYDNRDVGLSTHVHHLGRPNITAIMDGTRSVVPYTLADMAHDLMGLLDGLGIASAHLFGASMGGMIAQTAALLFPKRVRSLTSVMSHPGDRAVQPAAEALAVVMRPAARNREEFVAATLSGSAVTGSTEFPQDVDWLRHRAALSWDRGYTSAGVARQLAAIITQPDRTTSLADVRIPTLVVHGTSDLLIPILGGRLTAAAMPAAELLEIDGMGHDLPRAVWARILDKLDDVVHRGEMAIASRKPRKRGVLAS
jgi:pimeloyl-ACP methyl ester carboxylesterase